MLRDGRDRAASKKSSRRQPGDHQGQTRGMSQVSRLRNAGATYAYATTQYLRTFGRLDISSTYNPGRGKSDSRWWNAVDNLCAPQVCRGHPPGARWPRTLGYAPVP